jgi:arylformamidase
VIKDFITRRKFLLTGSALAAMPTLGLMAQEEKPVFRGWTVSQLNDQLNQGPYLPPPPELDKLREASTTNSEKVRAQYPPKTYSYGSSDAEKLDVFAPNLASDLPIMIFIHGGSWTIDNKDNYSTQAVPFLMNNAIYISVGFDNIPPNTMTGLVSQIRKAVTWVYKNAKRIGGDPNKLYISGHSSGGHLANMMLVTEWEKLGLPSNLLKGGSILSGWTDLYPVSISMRQQFLKLTAQEVKDYSPVNFPQNVKCPVIITCGGNESLYMQMQSGDWATKLQSYSRLAGAYRMTGYNHYTTPNLFNDTNNQVIKATLALMNLI